MPKKTLSEDENKMKKKSSSAEKNSVTKKSKVVEKKAKDSTKVSSKKVLPKPEEKKELPKPKTKKALPKVKETKALPKSKETKKLPSAKEKKLFPKTKTRKSFPKELSSEEKDLKLLEKIKDFFGRNPDKTSSIDDTIDEQEFLKEYYDLPYRYNETVVKILAQTPKRLFIYWDISDGDIEKYRKAFGDDFFEKTYPVLLVHNEELNYTYEVPINDFANSWYLDIKDSKCKYTVELGRKFKERPNFANNNEQIIEQENIILKNDYIEIVSSNTLEAPNDHVLFENLSNSVLYRNIKTYEEEWKDITTLFNGMAKIYNVYDLYKLIYKDEMNEAMFNLDNPGSAGNPSSSMTSSIFK